MVKRNPLLFLILAIIAGASGCFTDSFFQQSNAPLSNLMEAVPQPHREAFLMSLHTHSSFSEGTGTMFNHMNQAELAGYDGIWWTDHMGRQNVEEYCHRVGFEGDLRADINCAPLVSVASYMAEDFSQVPSSTSHFDWLKKTGGLASYSGQVDSESGDPYSEGQLHYVASMQYDRISLFAEPLIDFDFRLDDVFGKARFSVRIHLSSKFDGTAHGEERILECIPEGMPYFGGPPKFEIVEIPALVLGQWAHYQIDVHALAEQVWGDEVDLGLREFEFVFAVEDDSSISFHLDEMSLMAPSLSGAGLYFAQRRYKNNHLSPQVSQYVSSEIEGPFEQDILDVSSRDHLVGLFPDDLAEAIWFAPGTAAALNYPQSGVDWIHERDGAAILAHLYGAVAPPKVVDEATRDFLVSRVVDERAWGADGLEVGYFVRGRPLNELVASWDLLSSKRIYLTGVGSTDNHNVGPWEDRLNRMGSWLIAEDKQASHLCQAVKGGDVFFGDPFVFPPDGDLRFWSVDGTYQMGDVVPRGVSAENIVVKVDGVRVGDRMVFYKNGLVHTTRDCLHSNQQWVIPVDVAPGDWVRFTIGEAGEEAYLFSNPIYFIEKSATPPSHRAPNF